MNDHIEIAEKNLNSASKVDIRQSDALAREQYSLQAAQANALIAIARELAELRSIMEDVSVTLKDIRAIGGYSG